MTAQYQSGNPFSRYLSIADAAIDWQGLPKNQQELTVIDDEGLPFLAGVPELTHRAHAILEAVWAAEIEGHVKTEDGFRRPQDMQMTRESVDAWLMKKNVQLAKPAAVVAAPATNDERLLTTAQVMAIVKMSRSSIDRNIRFGLFPPATHPSRGGNKWRQQVIDDYIARPQKDTEDI